MATGKLTKICVDIETPLIERLREIYPQHGSIKWFFNEALRAFVEVHDPTQIDEDMKAAVEKALENNHSVEEEL